MPRGFLVKRNRKPCGSYRIPCEDNGSAQTLPMVMDVLAPYSSIMPTCSEGRSGVSDRGAQRESAPQQVPSEVPPFKAGGGLEKLGPWSNLPYSPVQPVGLEMKKTFFKRYLSSPATAESFPVSAAFSSMEKLISQHHNPFITPESKLHANPCTREAARSNKVPSKKHKASRKLHFTDEVTTSPVLGLKIKAEEPDVTSRNPLVKRPPLGEFICQLCKEQYPDPFALAQHKCSRIVRVEYRCPECDKIFSCPANLASHRRWHKPRALGNEVGKKVQMPLEGKENSSGRSAAISLIEQSARVQHQQSVDSDPLRRTPSSSFQSPEDNHTPISHSTPEDGNDEEAFHCPCCHKRFRRHAYLRKHLLTHQPYSPIERGQLTYPCALCGVHFPSMDIRDKHRLWHAVREELLLPLEEALVAEGGQQIFPCELCPTAFFSSPGLTLHMNKCHSAENRQDLPVQIPLGPGC
ncbi:PREDICTED: insulinoma-associated protein 2 [Nanorana parkeri]|uniref:insulinoma-associated protein 2 n=1 Tax=Nanorana parkeri TaxID=125878 RepID=UPI00085409FA|nr:PREDICTED: insulinoma-associated protein 2 [Nanorana parkeri]